MLENCGKEFYYYPIRALLEFYSDQVQERSLGKRLNATSLLEFKAKKERLGRVQQLADHKKKLGLRSDNE
jgi:phosphoenolpyruvate carboxylase